MRILIMGAGGLGAYFGGALAHSGHDVTFVARGAQLEAMRERGLELRVGEERIKVAPVRVLGHPSEGIFGGSHALDLVLFAVKTYDTQAAIEAIKPVIRPHTAVLTMQNGVDSVELLAEAFGPERVIVGPAVIVSAVTQPGAVEASGQRRLVLAELAGPPTPRLESIAAAFRDIGANVTVSSDARLALWEKFVPLATHATISSACQLPMGLIRDVPEAQELYRGMLAEAVAVGRASGVGLAPELAESSLTTMLRTVPASATSSMQRDFEGRRRVELEDLTGAMVRRGKQCDVPTPEFSALYAVLKTRALSWGGLS